MERVYYHEGDVRPSAQGFHQVGPGESRCMHP